LQAPTLLACFFLLPQPPRKNFRRDFLVTLRETDYLGVILVVGALIELLLIFQWGGLEHAWDSSVIIGLLVGFGLTVIVLACWILYRGESACESLTNHCCQGLIVSDLKPRVMRMRVIWVGGLLNFASRLAHQLDRPWLIVVHSCCQLSLDYLCTGLLVIPPQVEMPTD
jgi:hypothetical protein